ncbi:Microcystin-dependent protein [Rhizobiales bacterium GAS188]|nr:Microcystin-dependent protein [Rhizobiales bacterium GAS188]
MSAPYVGEIRMFGGNFSPAGWMFCDGAQVPISNFETLFQLIGTTYGGDGQTTFNLPDLRGRVPVHMGNLSGTSFLIGELAGVETVTLNTNQIPTHSHALIAATGTSLASPVGNFPGPASSTSGGVAYGPGPINTTLAPSTIMPTGGSQPHDNRQPYLGINFIISLFGIFPSPT